MGKTPHNIVNEIDKFKITTRQTSKSQEKTYSSDDVAVYIDGLELVRCVESSNQYYPNLK